MDAPAQEHATAAVRHPGRAISLVLVYALACAATWAAIGAFAGADPALVGRAGLTEKVLHLRAEPEPFDVYFVGASSVYRSFDPAVLDPALAAAGCPVRTYNLAVPGAVPVEVQTQIDEALRDNPDAVLVLGPTLPPRRDLGLAFDLKEAAFHDLEDVGDALAYADDAGWLDRVEAATLVGAAQVPVGHLHYRLYPERVRDLASGAVVRAGLETGYLPLEAELDAPDIRARRDRAVADMAEAGFDAWLTDLRDLDFGGDVHLEIWERLLDHVDRRAPVVLALPPFPFNDQLADLEDRWRAGGLTPVLSLHDPADFPILAREDAWFDAGHLTAPAAAEMSRAAAGPLCALLGEAGR